VIDSLLQVFEFVALLAVAVAVLEVYLHIHFTYFDRGWFIPGSVACALVLAAAAGHGLAAGRVLSLTLAAAAVQAVVALVFRYVVRGQHSLPIMLLAPGFIGLALLIAYPLFFEVYLAFHDLKLTTIMVWSRTGSIPFVGFKHFYKVFTSSPLSSITFLQLFGRTLWWTFINVFCHVAGGFILALLLNNCSRFRGLYRTFLVIPWAMPQVVAILALRGEFHSQYGFINIMLLHLVHALPFLAAWGVGPVEWLSRHPLLTCTLINVWLGIPFMMVIILGGLQSISKHYYDAAAIDGASAWQQLRHITLPLLRPVLGPAITLGTVWTFNNINVIYLVTGQAGGSEDADILVSALYKAAFTFYRYSYSAALAIVIFLILFFFSLLWLNFSKSSESVYG
jgi:arabinogalactan oligomer/maltooligosaccharide transport system permease protein